MAMNTWAANEIGKVNTIGLCHGVQGGAKLIEASLLSLHCMVIFAPVDFLRNN